MLQHLRPALVLLLGFSLLTGVVYPLAVTGVATLALPHQAEGSLVRIEGQVRGSALIGQAFASPRYFQGRPSAAGNGYDAASSSGSNLGPTSAKLKAQVAERHAALAAQNPWVPVPPELLFASASGLDPHLSPAAARFQIPRVARARGLPASALDALVDAHTRGRALGFLGEPTVNVLAVNLALDALDTPAAP